MLLEVGFSNRYRRYEIFNKADRISITLQRRPYLIEYIITFRYEFETTDEFDTINFLDVINFEYEIKLKYETENIFNVIEDSITNQINLIYEGEYNINISIDIFNKI